MITEISANKKTGTVEHKYIQGISSDQNEFQTKAAKTIV